MLHYIDMENELSADGNCGEDAQAVFACLEQGSLDDDQTVALRTGTVPAVPIG